MKLFSEIFTGPRETLSNFKNHTTKWISHGRMMLVSYRETDFNELIALKQQHNIYILKEPGTMDENKSGLFAIDWQKKEPLAGIYQISNCFNYDEIGNTGFLKRDMHAISNWIIACAQSRLIAAEAAGYNHLNGAIMLFCAEFAEWSNDAAKKQGNIQLLNELQDRLYYLSKIEQHGIFKNEAKGEYNINLLIFNLQQILEKSAMPKLQAYIQQAASRDLFSTLVTTAEDFYSNVTKGLFYLFTSDMDSGPFDIEYKDILISEKNEKILGKLLGEQFKRLEDKRKQIEQLNNRDLSTITNNIFLDGKGNPLFTLIGQLELDETSIYPAMKGNIDSLHLLVSTLGLLQDFCSFTSAFKQGFLLAGEGGNILIYIGLCQQTTQLIQCYSEIHDRLMKLISQIHIIIDKLKYDLMKEQKFTDPWIKNYGQGVFFLNQAQNDLSVCYENLQKMGIQMEKVRSHNYAHEIINQIEWFSNTVTVINKRFGKINQLGNGGTENLKIECKPLSISNDSRKTLVESDTEKLRKKLEQLANKPRLFPLSQISAKPDDNTNVMVIGNCNDSNHG